MKTVVEVGGEIIRHPGDAAEDAGKGAGNFAVGFTNAAIGTSFAGFVALSPRREWMVASSINTSGSSESTVASATSRPSGADLSSIGHESPRRG